MTYLRLLSLFLLVATAQASEVVGIVDGDTLDAFIDGKKQRIRLAQIDAPEKHQAFGSAAKMALSDLAFRKDCDIAEVDKDRYGRIVGQIHCDGVDINRTMVASGHAWAYRKYLTDMTYLDAENAAKSSKLGLWQDPSPIPPWEFRKR